MANSRAVAVNMKFSEFDVRIDRRTHWGNPFRIGKDGSRCEVIAKYKRLLWQRIQSGEVSRADLRALQGKKLGCWCKPRACHGDVLVAAIEWACAS